MNSCVYRGTVVHSRTGDVRHRFSYGLFMMYLDLDELPDLFDGYWCWSARRPALARFRREDYLGPADVPLPDAVRDTVEAKTGQRPTGPIRMLTHLRYFGYIQNPVTFYYVFNANDTSVDTIVAEVTNTPWHERHAYVVPGPTETPATTSRFDKALHVSPFWDMDHEYAWRFSPPEDDLTVDMTNYCDGQAVFHAHLELARVPITHRSLAGLLVRYPFMTVRVVAGIYWQAARLWMKGARFFTHPDKRAT